MYPRKSALTGLFALTVAAPLMAQANPSDRDPHAPIALHDLTKAQERLTRFRPLYDKTVRELEKIVASGGKTSARQLVDARVALRQLERGALDLEIHGETAGIDYSLRVEAMRRQFQEALTAFLGSPASAAQVAQVRQSLQDPRLAQNVNRALQTIGNLVKQERWNDAYHLLQDTFDPVIARTIFLSHPEAKQYLTDYENLNSHVTQQRHRWFRQQVQAALEEAGTAFIPDTRGLLNAVVAASSSLESQAEADVDGNRMSGPQCLEYFIRKWHDVHLLALRCRATEWARLATVRQVSGLPAPSLPNRVDDAAYDSFSQQMVQALAGIIQADAQRTDPREAETLYAHYLQVLAPAVSRVVDDRLETAVQQALDQLVAKSPELAEQVTAYRLATEQLLRWRQRVAGEAVEARDQEFPPGRTLLTTAFTSGNSYPGLLSEREPNLSEASLLAGSPAVLEQAAERLLQRPVRFDHIAGLPGGKMAVTHYARRHYATLPRPAVAGAIDALKRELFVSDATPPLTLAAATAIASAEQGDLQSIGGMVDAVYLEGLIPRFATLPPAALPMIPLGPLPTETIAEQQMLSQVVIRLQLTPAWVAHRYFFLDLAPPPQL